MKSQRHSEVKHFCSNVAVWGAGAPKGAETSMDLLI
jgi:hypothetical protein